VAEDAADREDDRIASFIDDGSAIAGGLAGLAITAVAGPVAGVGGGVAVARVAKTVGLAVWERLLEPLQRRRAAGVFAVAVGRAEERLDSGETVRSDGFLDTDREGNSPASELLEGTMIHAANAYQERKVPYMGFLWSSLLFRADITQDYAHLLLRLADRLTYRQLQALAYFAENANSDELTRLEAKREEEGHWPFADGLGIELNELGGDLGLLGLAQADGTVIRVAGTWNGGDLERANLWQIAVTSLGRNLYELMELGRIPEQEKRRILDLIRADH
jgi:hypothetical protein